MGVYGLCAPFRSRKYGQHVARIMMMFEDKWGTHMPKNVQSYIYITTEAQNIVVIAILPFMHREGVHGIATSALLIFIC